MDLLTEGLLNMLRVSAVNHGAVGGGSGGDSLKPSDVAVALGTVPKCERLALEVKAGLFSDGGCVDSVPGVHHYQRLQLGMNQELYGTASVVELLIVIREALDGFEWFRRGDMRSAEYRKKIDRASRCAVVWLVSGKEPKTVDKAASLGMSVSCFNKTWADRVRNIYQLILQWLINGDNALSKALSSGLKCA